MRLTGRSDDEPLDEVWAHLEPAEAFILYQALEFYFEECEGDPGWHHHVGGTRGPELTIAIAPPDEPTPD